jgi:hypothetical protein
VLWGWCSELELRFFVLAWSFAALCSAPFCSKWTARLAFPVRCSNAVALSSEPVRRIQASVVAVLTVSVSVSADFTVFWASGRDNVRPSVRPSVRVCSSSLSDCVGILYNSSRAGVKFVKIGLMTFYCACSSTSASACCPYLNGRWSSTSASACCPDWNGRGRCSSLWTVCRERDPIAQTSVQWRHTSLWNIPQFLSLVVTLLLDLGQIRYKCEGPQIFQKCRNHFKILGASSLSRSKPTNIRRHRDQAWGFVSWYQKISTWCCWQFVSVVKAVLQLRLGVWQCVTETRCAPFGVLHLVCAVWCAPFGVHRLVYAVWCAPFSVRRLVCTRTEPLLVVRLAFLG